MQDVFATTRRARIYELLVTQGEVRNSDLQGMFNVSDMTIRRDVAALEAEGLLSRVHGGAVPTTLSPREQTFDARNVEGIAEKYAIARSAVNLLEPGNHIYIDGSTTAAQFAKLAKMVHPLVIVTDSIRVLMETTGVEGIETVLLGGTIQPDGNTLSGPLTLMNVEYIHVQMSFFSASAMNEHEIMNPGVVGTETKRAILKRSKRRILLADSSKWQKAGFFRLCEWNDIDVLVTDTGLPKDAEQLIHSRGVKVVRADFQIDSGSLTKSS